MNLYRKERLFGTPSDVWDFNKAAKFDKQLMKKLMDGSKQKTVSVYAIDTCHEEKFWFVSMIPCDKEIVKLQDA